MMPNVLFLSRVNLLISLSLFCLPPPPPSLCTFIFYLFKAEYMDCIEHGKANRNVTNETPTGFYFTAVYLFILGICFLSPVFGRNKKSFSIPTMIRLLSCFRELAEGSEVFSLNRQRLQTFKSLGSTALFLLVFNCSARRPECFYFCLFRRFIGFIFYPD